MSLYKNASRQAFLLILPALIAMLFVHVIPIFWGILMSFIDLNTFNLSRFMSAPFVGFKNFVTIFTSGYDIGDKFIHSFINILLYGFIVMPIGFVISLAVALLLNQKLYLRTIARGLILLPYLTPDSVMYNVWRFIFQSRTGLLNTYLYYLGIIKEPIIWLVGDRALYAVVIASIWKGWPYSALVLLAGLQNIPKDLYEAATIDGASVWQRFYKITMPMLWPVCRTLLVLGFIWNFHSYNQFYVMLGGDTSARAVIPALVIQREAFTNMLYGIGSAMATVMLIVIFALSFFMIVKRKEERR